MKLLFFCILFLSHQLIYSQKVDYYNDLRDGNSYKIIQIGNLLWFQDDLLFKTKGSYCASKSAKNICSESNYYPITELNEVCPKGWRVPTFEDWTVTYNTLFHEMNQPVEFDTITVDQQNTAMVKMKSTGELLSSLEFGKDYRWVEGNHLKKGSYTIWVRHESLGHDRFHVHYGGNSFVQHHHEHHIMDKPKKQRRFCVRCVKDAE